MDQDYPLAIQQKRKEYSEVKQVLKQNKIRFQTPFPAKLRVFYVDDMWLCQAVEEATTNMKDRTVHQSDYSEREPGLAAVPLCLGDGGTV